LIRFVMLNHLKIGKLLVVQHGDTVGKGQYGKVFSGQYDDAVDVSVLRVDREVIKVDTKILRQTCIQTLSVSTERKTIASSFSE